HTRGSADLLRVALELARGAEAEPIDPAQDGVWPGLHEPWPRRHDLLRAARGPAQRDAARLGSRGHLARCGRPPVWERGWQAQGLSRRTTALRCHEADPRDERRAPRPRA